MARIGAPNIPAHLARLGDEAVKFFQSLLDYRHRLTQTGTRIKWGSTVAPTGGYLILDGTTITNADYPDLIRFAANDADFTVGASTTTLPTDAGFWVKT